MGAGSHWRRSISGHRDSSDPTPHLRMSAYSEHTTISFVQELVNASAVVLEARMRKPPRERVPEEHARGVFEAAAMILANNYERPYDEITQMAQDRARHLFSSGQDWRRELELYKTLLRFGKGDRNAA